MDTNRIRALDGLRGIAALTVVITHVLWSFGGFDAALDGWPGTANPLMSALDASPARLLWAGRQAVILFFVLSGFVLTLQLERARGTGYAAYVVRRMARLYLPYLAVMVAAAALVSWLYSPVPQLSFWFNTQWIHPPLVEDLVAIVGLNRAQFETINSPAWSLVHEMRVSLLFPVIALLARSVKSHRALVAGFVLASVAPLASRWLPGPFVAGQWVLTLQVSGLFLLGAALAAHRDLAANFWNRWFKRRSWLVLGIAFLLYGWGRATPFVAVGAVLLVLVALLDPTVQRWLESSIPQWLGRVSYSLYLSHMVVLLTLVHALGAVLAPWILVVIAPIAALGLAEILYRWLELPSQAFGRQVAARMQTRPAVDRAGPAGRPAALSIAPER